MSIIHIILLFICFNVPIYILIMHFGAKREESKLLVRLSILSSTTWFLLIAMLAYLFLAPTTNNLLRFIPVILVVLAVISSLLILLIKLIELYKK